MPANPQSTLRVIVLSTMITPMAMLAVGFVNFSANASGFRPSLVHWFFTLDGGFLADPVSVVLATIGAVAFAAGLALRMPGGLPRGTMPGSPAASVFESLHRVRVLLKCAVLEIPAILGFVSLVLSKDRLANPQTVLVIGVLLAEIGLLKLLVLDVPRLSEEYR